MTQKDALGARMKENYEFRSRSYLPRRTYTVIRIDGKAFHTYTRGLDKPFDLKLMDDMSTTAQFLCEEIMGAKYAYAQSDEISILMTDFDRIKTEAWFDGNVQKITSVTASMATAKFNELRPGKLAFFDARVFVIPDPVEVANYFVWRQKDATRNAISMAAQAHFSHRALQGKSASQMQEMLFQDAGVNFNDYPDRCKRGTEIVPVQQSGKVSYVHNGETVAAEVLRRVWTVDAPPIYTQHPGHLARHIPALPSLDTVQTER